MAKDKARPAPRPRAETPKGFRDAFGPEVLARQEMLARIAEVYRRYGFDPLETPAVETVEALGKFLPDVDRPNDGVFAWQEDGDWLALRYDLTAPLARVAAQHRADLPMPYRRYAMGPVWRNEKPGPGRFRQFTQCDADTVGAASVAADAEICAMLCDALEAAGIARGDYVVKVNNRKILDGVMEMAGLSGEANADRRGIVLRAIDKMDRLGRYGVVALLGDGRRDESGDFTRGASLSPNDASKVYDLAAAGSIVDDALARQASSLSEAGKRGAADTLHQARDWHRPGGPEFEPETAKRAAKLFNDRLLDHLEGTVGTSQVGADGVWELRQLSDLLYSMSDKYSRIVVSPETVRGLGYYTGPVFEAELTFETPGEDGVARRFGSVAGGGRYDDLVRRFTGQAVPATGVSIGVDRLLAALSARGQAAAAAGPVVVTVMDRERMADYFGMAAELRAAGIRAEVYLGNPKSFGNQLKYADRRRAPVAVIQGADEAARGVVQIKDLVAGAAMAAEASVAEWKAQPAQREVARADLVAEVRGMLG